MLNKRSNYCYRLALLFLVVIFNALTSCARQQPITEKQVYFSYKSGCNVSMQFMQNKTVRLGINGKTQTCTIEANSASKDYFNLRSAGQLQAIFLYDEKEILILNQQYQFNCEVAKGISLSPVSDDLTVLADFQQYDSDREYLWGNLGAMNDKAYYLQGYLCHETAVYILNKILIIDPNRVVAWLNLADSQWALHRKPAAKKAYQQYLKLMKSQNKTLNKVPKRVYVRTA